jgi:hypothetical protein
LFFPSKKRRRVGPGYAWRLTKPVRGTYRRAAGPARRQSRSRRRQPRSLHNIFITIASDLVYSYDLCSRPPRGVACTVAARNFGAEPVANVTAALKLRYRTADVRLGFDAPKWPGANPRYENPSC